MTAETELRAEIERLEARIRVLEDELEDERDERRRDVDRLESAIHKAFDALHMVI